MKRSKIIGFLAAALLSLATPALAQSTCPYIVYGAVLTVAQWNVCFTNKQDALGFTPLNQAGGTITGALTVNGGITVTTGFTATGLVTAADLATGTQGDVLYADAGGVWARLGHGTSGQVLTTNGASANPSWSNASAGNALFGTATGNVANDIVTLSNTTTGVQDSGIAIQTKGAWTPADASSSSLVFTIDGTNACNNSTHVCANYTLNGNLVTVYAAFFVSSNSSGNPGSVSGLPFNTANKVYGVMPLGAVVGNTPFTKTAFAFTTQNSSTIRLLYQDGTNVLNSTMSTYEITFTGTYPLN